ncbi:MAG: hypothetical protein J0M12_09955 [Deltaproteobacteria bacterium]|nr:hypothetical protein [Deltaproteobacteria bacterium]
MKAFTFLLYREMPEQGPSNAKRVTGDLALPSAMHDDRTELAVRHATGSLTERDALTAGTHSTARNILSGWLAADRVARVAERRERSSETTSEVGNPYPELNALAPVPRAGDLLGQPLSSISQNPLEDYRLRRGFSSLREEIYTELARGCSVAAGLKTLNEWTRKHIMSGSIDAEGLPVGSTCKSLADAKRLFPELTVSELAFLSLVATVPTCFKTASTGFDAKSARASEYGKTSTLSESDSRATPMQLELRTDGICYATNQSRLGGDGTYGDPDRSQTNPHDREIVAYRPGVAERLQQLIILSIDSPRLFELVRSQTTDSLSVGVGRIQQLALNRVQGREGDSIAGAGGATQDRRSVDLPSVRDDLQALTPEARDAVRQEEQLIASRVLRAKVSHTDGSRLGSQELIELIGILRDIPACLLQEKPFTGSVLFDGANLLFAKKPDETIVEVCPLEFQCAESLRHAIFHESTQTAETNRTMLRVESELVSRVHGNLFGNLLQSNPSSPELQHSLSRIEYLSVELFRSHGVNVLGSAMREFRADQPETVEAEQTRVRLKLSVAEMEQLQSVIERLPADLFFSIRNIEKEQRGIGAREFTSTNQTCLVSYEAESQTIRILELQELPFTDLHADARGERAFLLAQAIGSSLWPMLSEREFWSQIRLAEATNPREIREALASAQNEAELFAIGSRYLRPGSELQHANFVHPSGLDTARADFAGCFAAYCVAPEQFRALGLENTAVEAKRRWIEAFVQERGLQIENSGDDLISLADARKGLLAHFKNMPDITSQDGIAEYLANKNRSEEAEIIDEDDDEHEGVEVTSRAEVTLRTKRDQIVKELKGGVEGAFSGADESDVQAIAERLYDGLLNDEIDDAIADILDEYEELADYLDGDDFEDAEEVLRGITEELDLSSFDKKSDSEDS